MTEAEWLTCAWPVEMLEHLGRRASERKKSLLAAACFRRIWRLLPTQESREAVEVLERFAEGEATADEWAAARGRAWQAFLAWGRVTDRGGNITGETRAGAAVTKGHVHDMVIEAADATALAKVGTSERASSEPEERAQCDLVRDIFGNPFRRVAVDPSWLAWNDGTVVKLAQGIYEQRAFDRLPVLADALEEAGCTNTDILGHCRGRGEHVRGCWVVGLILGKE
jgi:hypothetical protein